MGCDPRSGSWIRNENALWLVLVDKLGRIDPGFEIGEHARSVLTEILLGGLFLAAGEFF